MSLRRKIRIGAAWADDYRHILGVQVRSRISPHPPEHWLEGHRRPVLLLPGIYETWHYLEPLAKLLHERGHPIVAVPELGRNLTSLDASSHVVAGRLRVTGTNDLVVLAHSKGGLIGKGLMLGQVGSRVRGMVAINTPFAGSVHGRWFPDASVRILSDRDRHLRELTERRDVDHRIVSLYAAFDPHVPAGSYLPGARNVRVEAVGHFRIVDHPTVVATTLEAVARFDAALPGSR